MSPFLIKVRNPKSAFSLVEVTLAVGIAGFCLLAVFGLLPVGLTSNQNAIEQTAAAGWASAVASDLRSTPATSTSSPQYKISLSDAKFNIFLAEDGTRKNTAADARYRANVWLYPPSGGQKTATVVRILITWPAVADSVIKTDASKYSGSYEVMTTLDRN